MPNKSIRILSPTDRGILDGFAKIAEELGSADKASFLLRVGDSGSRQYADWQGPLAELESSSEGRSLAEMDSMVLSLARLNGPAGDGSRVDITRGADRTDMVVVFPDTSPPESVISLIAAAVSVFEPYDSAGNLESVVTPALARFHETQQATLDRLQRLTEQLVKRNEDYRVRLDEQFDDKARTLEEKFSELDRELHSSWEKKNEELLEREQALAEREQELDDRASRHARRDLRRDLKGILEERSKSFKLTDDTTRKRTPIHLLFIGLTLILGLYAIDLVVDQLGVSTPPDLADVLRAALSLVTLTAVVGFYIRWNDVWARDHAEEEFRLRQLELDVDRASWVVEMALEWKEEKESEIPPALVERLSHGLFESKDKPGVRPPATEDLASALLRAASGMSLTLPGVGTLEIDRKGLRRFGEAAAEAGDGE